MRLAPNSLLTVMPMDEEDLLHLPDGKRGVVLSAAEDVRRAQMSFERPHKPIFCACRFERVDGLGGPRLIEACGFHAQMAGENAALRRALEELSGFFRSGNSVPVERASISAKEFWRICEAAGCGEESGVRE